MHLLQIRGEAEALRGQLAAELAEIGYRLDRDPNGYAIVQPSVAIVARCPNLVAVEAWLRERRRALEPQD